MKEKIKKIIGIDGEGQDTPDGRHIYTYLCAVNEEGILESHTRFAEDGLSTLECVDMILSLPKNTIKFGYMFSYDVTKIIEDIKLDKRYYLLRPDARKKRQCPLCKKKILTIRNDCPKCKIPLVVAMSAPHVPVNYKYEDSSIRTIGFGFFNGSLTIADGVRGRDDEDDKKKWQRSVKINDCFRFFGAPFVDALESWEMGNEERRKLIRKMKALRGEFDTQSPDEIMKYCQEECALLAQMMRKLITAHEEAGIPLRQYFGAGSTASALLTKNNVDLYKGKSYCKDCNHEFSSLQRECDKCKKKKTVVIRGLSSLPIPLQIAILSAYFGGRFENSGIGFVDNLLYSKDIASAYPYALTFLPCLRCGNWIHIPKFHNSNDSGHDLALVRFKVKKVPSNRRRDIAWMPLPCRTEEGSICYPTGFEGWAWWPELKEAILGWREYIEVGEAWIYRAGCDHKPFGFIPATFRQRIAWGKEGKGLVLKLGMNATYGKAAQVRGGGNPPFQSWVWAGMTTSTCRAMILRLIRSAQDRWNVHAIATDGIYTSEKLISPMPIDTGTFGLKDNKGKLKPGLGEWENKEIEEGGFFVKPGLYWRKNVVSCGECKHTFSNVELNKCPNCGSFKLTKEIRARGIGRKEALDSMIPIQEAFLKWDRQTFDPQVETKSRRFFGAKHSIYMMSSCRRCGKSWVGVPEKGCPNCEKIGSVTRVSELENDKGYPLYGTWTVRTSKISFDPHPKREREKLIGNRFCRMHVLDMGGMSSLPYIIGKTTPEGEEAREFKEMLLEQPDWEG